MKKKWLKKKQFRSSLLENVVQKRPVEYESARSSFSVFSLILSLACSPSVLWSPFLSLAYSSVGSLVHSRERSLVCSLIPFLFAQMAARLLGHSQIRNARKFFICLFGHFHQLVVCLLRLMNRLRKRGCHLLRKKEI